MRANLKVVISRKGTKVFETIATEDYAFNILDHVMRQVYLLGLRTAHKSPLLAHECLIWSKGATTLFEAVTEFVTVAEKHVNAVAYLLKCFLD